MKNLANKGYTRYLLNRDIIGAKGRKVARIKPYREDIESNLAAHITEQITINASIMMWLWEQAISNELLTESDVISFITRTPVFDNERKPFIEWLIKAYFKEDYQLFCMLLIPQIEEGLRNLLEELGGVIYLEDGDTFILKTFDKILRDPLLEQELRNDITTYLRLVFTDAKGFNIRNDLMHGIKAPDKINSVTGFLVFHSLLLFGLLIKPEELPKEI